MHLKFCLWTQFFNIFNNSFILKGSQILSQVFRNKVIKLRSLLSCIGVRSLRHVTGRRNVMRTAATIKLHQTQLQVTLTMSGKTLAFHRSGGFSANSVFTIYCVRVYLLEGFRVGLSGVVGHVRDVGLVEVGVEWQSVQRQISVAVRGVGSV